jgi:hypothetical protein
MLDQIPFWLVAMFIGITLATYIGLLMSLMFGGERAQRRLHVVALVVLAWLIFQSALSLNRWYMDREAMPPHLVFPVATMIVIISLLFLTSRGRRFVDGLSPLVLTLIHVIRIPVEISLYWLAFYKQVPWSMTFYGHNFDIIFGITAPFIAYFGVYKKKLSPAIIKGWNVLGLISLLVIVVTAFGAAPSPMQAWSFDQPNYAVLHFPFTWLPSFIVPIVLFAHLKAILRGA